MPEPGLPTWVSSTATISRPAVRRFSPNDSVARFRPALGPVIEQGRKDDLLHQPDRESTGPVRHQMNSIQELFIGNPRPRIDKRHAEFLTQTPAISFPLHANPWRVTPLKLGPLREVEENDFDSL